LSGQGLFAEHDKNNQQAIPWRGTGEPHLTMTHKKDRVETQG
jgi:hypothetical protein